MSVLVDDRFGGSVDDLRAARAATSLPLLAKGFFTEEARPARAAERRRRRRAADPARPRRRARRARSMRDAARARARHARRGARRRGARARDRASAPIRSGSTPATSATFAIDRRAQLRLVARAPRDRVVIAESGDAHARPGRRGRARRRRRDPRRHRADARARSGRKLRELISRPLVKVCGLTRQEDVDVGGRGGRRPGRLHPRRERARAAPRRCSTCPTRCSRSRSSSRTSTRRGADLVQLYRRENGHRGRDGVLLRDDEQVATGRRPAVAQQDDPTHLERARGSDGPRDARRRPRPGRTSARRSTPCSPWAVDAARASSREPGIKDHDTVRAFVEAAR